MAKKSSLVLMQSGMPGEFYFVMRNRSPLHILPENQLHWHDYFEIELIYEGTGQHIVNGTTQPLMRGDAYLLTPLDFHTVIADRVEGMSLYNINFSDSILPPEISEILNAGFLYMRFDEETFVPLLEKVKQLHKEYNGSDRYRETMIKAAVTEICVTLLREISVSSPPQSSNSTDEVIHKAVLYLHKNIKNPPQKHELAEKYHLSPNYFGERFHKAVGMSYTEYVKLLRLRYAANLLKSSGLSVSDICLNAGFNTTAYFIRTFKDRYGLTPLQYRKHCQSALPSRTP